MGRPAGEPDPARRARAAERARSHPTHQSHCPHLRGTSGFRGNFGQPQLPGCSATARSSAVNSGSRKRRAACRPGRAADGASGTPGTGAQPRHPAGHSPAGHSPAWCAPGPLLPGGTAMRPRDQSPPAAATSTRHQVPLTGRHSPTTGPASCEPAWHQTLTIQFLCVTIQWRDDKLDVIGPKWGNPAWCSA
jgi:hypothetical protein